MRLMHDGLRLAAGMVALVALSGALAATAPAGHCAELARHLPNLSRALCEQAALAAPGAVSVRGVPLYQRDVLAPRPEELSLFPVNSSVNNAGNSKPAKPYRRVLVIGGIHGDELSSTSLVFHWIAQANDTAAGMDWRFLPALNPDGLLLPRPTRVNANGVDLNRNFPTPGWEKEAPVYWQKRTNKDPRRWPGRAALSEPESRFIVDTLAQWKPDLIVTVHAPYGVLDYDGPSVPPQRLGRLYLDRVGIFPGSLGHYGGVHKGVPV
ncbi:MAG TPA: M14 family zinc carboxypeptidase, partial [Rhizobacter sp.]|nr:M14 family zinc carboxypeptidase [Rhizobacter sp.]